MNRTYLLKRAAHALLTLFAVLVISFFLIRLLPGDPEAYLTAIQATGPGSGGELNPSRFVDDASYNQPIWIQFFEYLTTLAQGKLGQSIRFQRPVIDILAEAIPWTIFVIGTGVLLVYAIGIVLGATLAYSEGTRFDITVSTVSTVLNSIPYYVAGILLVYFLGYQSSLFPKAGRVPQGVEAGFHPEFILGVLHHATLPIFSVVITAFGFRALAMRGNSIQVLGEDFVRVARLRGLSSRRITIQYVGRNAVLPMYTGLMIALGFLLGGSIVLEQVFQYQGMGYYYYQAILSRDYPLMMGGFLVITLAVVVGLFIADVTYGFIDPRASVGGTESSNDRGEVSVRESVVATSAWIIALLTSLRHRLTRADNPHNPEQETRSPPDIDNPAVQENVFETTSDTTITRNDYYRRRFENLVLNPARIIRSDTRALVGGAIILAYILVGTVAVALYPVPEPDQGPPLVGPFHTLTFPLGTDAVGRDILGMLIHSTPAILKMMTSGALFATLIATSIGLLAGYGRGRVDGMLMFCADVAMAIPVLPLVMVLAVIFEPTSPWIVGLLLSVNAWGGTARTIRSQVLTITSNNYVEASGIMSLRLRTILVKDILPNIAPYVSIQLVRTARGVIFAAVALYYLGVLPFVSTNWGVMLNQAQKSGALINISAAHWILAPTIAIVGLVYGLILFAQGTDRIFNPRVRARHHDQSDGETEAAAPAQPSASSMD